MGVLFPTEKAIAEFRAWANPQAPLTAEGTADRLRFLGQKLANAADESDRRVLADEIRRIEGRTN